MKLTQVNNPTLKVHKAVRKWLNKRDISARSYKTASQMTSGDDAIRVDIQPDLNIPVNILVRDLLQDIVDRDNQLSLERTNGIVRILYNGDGTPQTILRATRVKITVWYTL